MVGIDAFPVGQNYHDDDTRGAMSGFDRGAPSLPPTVPFGFRFLDYFDPDAKLKHATVDPTEMVRAALSSGASPPTSEAPGFSLQVVPVLGRVPGVATGFLAQFAGTLAWVQEGRAQAVPLGQSIQVAVSAVAESRESLLVLMGDGTVFRTSKDSVAALFNVPSGRAGLFNDALGLAADREVAVLRFADRVPTSAQPALAYRQGKPPLALAGWNSALPATAPACAGETGYRAIVVVDQSWLELSSDASPNDRGMTAAVRWSPERVCVEAVELGETTTLTSNPRPQRVVARFSPTPSAARLASFSGEDLRQTLSCELLPAP